MKITKKPSLKPIKANEEVVEEPMDEVVEEPEIEIDPEATALVFEVEDVAQLVAEITEEDVEVEAEEDFVEFTVGEETFTVEAEGDEEILEASSRVRGRKVLASTKPRRKVYRKRR